MSAPAAPSVPLTFEQLKPGLPVMFADARNTDPADIPRSFRGKVVSVKSTGWAEVRFDDGVTRMVRAKALARDTVQVVELKTRPAAAPPTGSAAPSFNVEKPRAVAAPTSKPVRTATKGNGKTPKSAKSSKSGGACLCACGGTAKPGRSFLPGHDARFHGWMRRLADGRLKPEEVPAAALKLMNIDKDNVPTTDYDGSPWSI